MAMYICNRCGEVVDEEDLPFSTTMIPDQYGRYCTQYDTEFGCSCGGDYVEASQCEVCHEWVDAEETYNHNGICEKCFKSKLNIDTAILCGDAETESVDINGFITSCLTPDEINEILIKAIREANEQKGLEDDIETFLETSEKYEEIIRGEENEENL